MDEIKYLKKKLILTILLVVLVGATITVSTTAWFTKNRDVGSHGQTIQIEGLGVLVDSYDVYKYYYDDNEARKVTDGNYDMTPYDSIFTYRNTNTPLVFELNLSGLKSRSLNLVIECDSAHTDATADYVSNIVRARAAGKTAINNAISSPLAQLGASTTDRQKFDTVKAYFANNGTDTKFVTVTKTGSGSSATYSYGTKRTAITIQVDLTDEALTDTKATVYLIIDYDDLLVEAQQVSNFGSADIIGDTADFPDDFTRIYVYQ